MPLPQSEQPGRLQSELMSRGLRMTRQRRTILQVVETAKQHLDASQILRKARKIDAAIDRVTVYRTLSLLKRQGLGGSIVFVGSKNALAASPGAAAYCTAKAAELHLARCLALEGAAYGIRVNVVNPDAVLRGSRIWQGEWATQRAAQNKTSVDNLEAVYRDRSLLKRSVYPEDVAEAVAFFASERSAKSTGNIVNVDAGNAGAFTR